MRRVADKKSSSSSAPADNGGRTKASQSTQSNTNHGYHPTVAVATAYSGTFCMYLLGNLLPNLPELPASLIRSILASPEENSGTESWAAVSQIIFALMFTFHFCRRAVETVFVHTYVRTNSLFELVGVHIYYWFFAFWMGWSIREDLGYIPTHTPLFISGVILFWIAETGNCAVHLQFRDMRKKKLTKSLAPTGRAIPRGRLFSLVSCPHYTFEILTWLGFAMASMVSASFAMLSATVIVLLIMSLEHHTRYMNEFDGKSGRELYPTNRKALIPFIY